MLIGYVFSGAVLCVWAEFIMLATNRTEAVVNKSRAELYMCIESRYVRGVDRTCRETCVLGGVIRMEKGTR